MLARFALNFVIYLVFGGGIFAFVALRSTGNAAAAARPDFAAIVIASLVLALWSGGLTTLIERRVVEIDKLVPRAGLAALLGALSLGGFAVILSWVAWKQLPPSFIGLGLVAGAMMHGARAFAKGQRAADDDDDDEDGEAPQAGN